MSTANSLQVVRSVATLSQNGRKARYGVAYLRSIFSQAGVGFTETSIDEDVSAIDGTVNFHEFDTRIQVKCTSTLKLSGRSISWKLDQLWREKWSRNHNPTYFVLVIIDTDKQIDWVTHHVDGTRHKSGAFWVRVDNIGDAKSIKIPKVNRFTLDTVSEWHVECLANVGIRIDRESA
jgi:hypothetical protein